MFEVRLFDDKEDKKERVADIIVIKCINLKKETGLYLRNSSIEEMITKFMLNTILHHVGMSWIIYSNKEL